MPYFTFFYIISISFLVTHSPFWICIAYIFVSKNNYLYFLTALIVAYFCIHQVSNLKNVYIPCDINGCYLNILPYSQQNLRIANIPDQYPSWYIGEVQIKKIFSILPITKQSITMITSLNRKDLYEKKTYFIDPLNKGLKNCKNFDTIFLYGGWAHYFCFSGWHSNTLLKLCGNNKYYFTLIGFFINIFLGLSFPFLRSYLEVIVKNSTLALFLGLCILPFAPMTMSFWMTLYFQHLTRNCKVNDFIFVLTSLAFNQLFMGKINLVIFVIFQCLSQKVATEVIVTIIAFKTLGLLHIVDITILDDTLEKICATLLEKANVFIRIPEVLCYFILFICACQLRFKDVQLRKDSRYS